MCLKKVISVLLGFFCLCLLEAQAIIIKNSNIGLFTYKVPADWKEARKDSKNVIEFVEYIKDDTIFMLSTIDVYEFMRETLDSKYTRLNFSYNFYSEKSMQAALEGYLDNYPLLLTYENFKVENAYISNLNGMNCLYVYSTFTQNDIAYNHETVEFLVNGYSSKFTFIYSEYEKAIEDIMKSVRFK